jgi:hypothetical protein
MAFKRNFPITLLFLLFAMPASINYEMRDVGFGSGGVGVTESTTYAATGTTGEVSAGTLTGSAYDLGPGLQFSQQTNTPAAPTFSNPNSHYNKLKLILDTGSNPTDTLFAVGISTDNFVTTNYVQADNTIGATPSYQTYTNWGGASGIFVVGLSANTTYKVKVKAVQTKYTESAFSAAATAATVAPTLSYDIDVSAGDSESSAPYIVNFGTLNVGSVTTATDKVWIDLDTNAESGAFVYLYANNGGLTSASTGSVLNSTSGDLSVGATGYGVRVSSVAQSSGNLTAVSPYNGSNDVVGIIDTTSRTIFNSNNAPITAGRGSILLKAKASTTTPAADDYSTIITMIASATF